ncbi:hypothetical protein LCGC14_0658140 [marine sediment metagenome]|uniref:Uncharacterized protein n=1 Tax=marine sediment metagenome TaxID=412755 RepID=A0A0F9QUF7_9ZZZZ
MMTKNKFAHPPHLPEFKKEDALRLRKILHIISRTCCRHITPEGAIGELDNLLERPSRIRECDLYVMKPLVDAINMVAEDAAEKETGLTTEQLEYLFREYIKEVHDEHLYDAARQLAWYTGFGITLKGEVYEIDRKDGAYSFWWDKPYAEMTEEQYRKLIGEEKENWDEGFPEAS